jgi:flavin reductase (DIM6/NTAB) family NADH-FMN oxidoreductase RutF
MDPIRYFKNVMASFPTGVTVVTSRLNGDVAGLTVNSFMSVSLDPLLIVISISRTSTTHEVIRQAGKYTVSILAEGQSGVSTIFAGAPSRERFACVPTFESPMGHPVVQDAVAYIDAEVINSHDEGDHTLFIGRVTDMKLLNPDAKPLAYHRSRYQRLADPEQTGAL